MKQLISIVFLLLSISAFGQYPVSQSIGSDSTLVTSKGALRSRLINMSYLDTTAANLQRIKFYDGAQIYTKSGGAKFWIRDSTLNKWVQFQAGAATAFVDSITLSSSQTTDTLKYWKAGTGTTVGYIDRPDGLIQGGIVTWSGVGLIYDITSAIYWIDNVRYTSAAQSVTLAAADPTDPTIYTFYLDNTGTFGAIRGTPDPDPVETLPDAGTQLYRGFVVVNAGATTPAVTQTVIYDENLGPTSEWTGQSVGGTTNFGGVTNPFNGTKTTDIGAFTTGKTVTYVDFTNFQTTSYNTLKMYIRLKAAFANNTNINLQFLNGSTVVNTVPITLGATHGFSKSIVGTYQNISVLLSAFTFTSNTVDRLKITFTGSNASGLYIDYVQLQAGTNNNGSGGPWEPVITPVNLQNYYYNGYKRFVPFNTDSIPEGSTNFWATAARVIGIMSGQNISIFNNNSLYQTSTNLHDSLVIVNARIDSLAALQDTTWTTTGVGTGANLGKPLFAFHDIATNTDSLALDTTLMATRAYVLNNAGGSGTVTAVTGTAPIASSGGTTPVISLNNTAVTPGSYTATNLTVDAQGRITAAANGSAGGSQTLQQTTDLGNTTTKVIYSTDSIKAYSLYSSGGAMIADSSALTTDTTIFYGASIEVGSSGIGSQALRWTTLSSTNLGTTEVNKAIASTSFRRKSGGTAADSAFMDRLVTIPTYRTTERFIVIGASNILNDLSFSIGTSTLAAAISQAIDTIHLNRGWPLNRIILALPSLCGTYVVNTTHTNDSLGYYVRTAIAAAISKGVPYVDNWTYTTNNGGLSLINADSVHPTATGHYEMTQGFTYRVSDIKVNNSLRINRDFLVKGTAYIGGKLTMPKPATQVANFSGQISFGNGLLNDNGILFFDNGTTGLRTGLGMNTGTGDFSIFTTGTSGRRMMFGSGQDASTLVPSNSNFYIENSGSSTAATLANARTIFNGNTYIYNLNPTTITYPAGTNSVGTIDFGNVGNHGINIENGGSSSLKLALWYMSTGQGLLTGRGALEFFFATGLDQTNITKANSSAYINTVGRFLFNGLSTAYLAKTTTYTAVAADHTINCTSGTFTITLPSAAGTDVQGRQYVIVNSGSGTITIGTTSSQTFVNITAAPTTLTLGPVGAAAITSYTVVSDGANWIVTGKVKNE